jgi:hypothetical protein
MNAITQELVALSDITGPPLQGDQRSKLFAQLMRDGITLDPVHLTRDGELFEVQDGRHRIAAARLLGLTHISALVYTRVNP